MSHLLAFAVVGLIAVAVPGPDFAIVSRNALLSRRLGVFTAGGIALGLSVHGMLAALGLSAILVTSAAAFTVVKIAGAVYLTYLGFLALRAAFRRKSQGEDLSDAIVTAKPKTAVTAFRQGFLTNVLNPKAVFFFISLLPQFVPAGGSVTSWTALFAGSQVVIAFLWFVFVSWVVAVLRRAMAKPKVSRAVDGVTGTAFVGLAVRLAFERH